jgi:hypothetical protein
MAYAPLDEHFDEHPKFEELELEHYGLMACAITYCNRNLTDGKVSFTAVRRFGKSIKGPKLAKKLTDLGIWAEVEGGWEIVGYLDHNASREQVLAKREATRRRKDDWKKRQEGAPRNQPQPPTPPVPPPGEHPGTPSEMRLRTHPGTRSGTHPGTRSERRPEQTHYTDTDTVTVTALKSHPNPPVGRAVGHEAVAVLRRLHAGDAADDLHDRAEKALSLAGFSCSREFEVEDRGDGRRGFVDLVARRADVVVAIELDRATPREKSIRKLQQVRDAFRVVVLREAPPGVAQDERVDAVVGLAKPTPEPMAGGSACPRLVAVGTASAEELVAAYESAVSAATERPFAVPNQRMHRDALALAANTHLRADETIRGVLAATREAVAEWVDAYRDRPQLTAGWAPRKFLDWLNAERDATPEIAPPPPEDLPSFEPRPTLTEEQRANRRAAIAALEGQLREKFL